jgi:hypothetical protein
MKEGRDVSWWLRINMPSAVIVVLAFTPTGGDGV